MEQNQQTWNDYYIEKGKFLYWPAEELVAFAKTYLMPLERKRVLDIGCGAGRNLLFFGKEKAEIHGIDTSEAAVVEARRFLGSENLDAKIALASSTRIPYDSNQFDLCVLWGVFHYLTPEDQARTQQEVRRVLKNKSWTVFTLRSVNDSDYGKGVQVAEHTFMQRKPGKKELHFQYWTREEAERFFRLENILMGEKVRAPIGGGSIRNVHWLVAGQVSK